MINTVVEKKSTVRQRDLVFLVHDIFVSHEGELHDSVMSCDLYNLFSEALQSMGGHKRRSLRLLLC